ncbi:H-NS histone family protein [Stenotrophomonas sp.]|uniref:H-NS histone family protein n=1 Tax=Stenotrophomonas sp. TaxID=69392 RepID=UPI0028AEB307|nr:H-NS histone family protein [Stenotrophomonas sp.]
MSIDLSGLSAKELGALIKNAKKRQTVVAKRPAITKVRAQLNKLLKSSGYTVEEVFGSEAPARGRVAKAAKAPAKKAVRKLGKVAPKYRNPANPKETWTGRGKQPRWLAAHTTKGKKLEDFLIKK